MWQGEIDGDLLVDELEVHETLIDQVHLDLNVRADVQAVQEGGQPAAVQLDKSHQIIVRLKVRLSELGIRVVGGDFAQSALRSQRQRLITSL